MKTIRIVLLPLILASIIALFSMTGCSTGGTTSTLGAPQGELSQQQLEQILNDSVTNQQNINTYKFDMYMDISAEVIGGSEAGRMGMNYKLAGGVNTASRQMQMNMEISMDFTGFGSQSMNAEMYLISDWAYMKVEVPGQDEQWVKMPASEELNQIFSTEAIDQQIGMLESPMKVEYIGTERVDGLDCYVLSVTPDMKKLAEWIGQQNTGAGDIDWGDLSDISNLFKKLSYVCYVVKDTNIMKKMVMEMQMEFTPDQVDDYSGDYEKGIMEFNIDMNLFDHNQPFSVTLPAEAENAMQAPAGMF